MNTRLAICSIGTIFLLTPPALALTLKPPLDIDHTPLHEAAEKCDVPAARELAGGPVDRERKDRHERTPLMLAAERGCIEVVRLLVDGGAKIDNGKASNKRTALLLAAEHGHAEVVSYLLGRGADPGARTSRGDTALILALRGSLFQKGAEGVPRETVAALLKYGAEVNVKGEYGRTPLMWSVARADARLVWPLLQKGADPATADDKGKTAVTMAEEMKLEYLTRLLKNPQRPDLVIQGESTLLSEAIKQGKAAEVALLLQRGADVNGRFGNAGTPLMQAASTGNMKIVELLLQKGADVNAKNGTDFTPLMFAATAGRDKIVSKLLTRGADVHSTSSGRSALVFAVMNNRVGTARILLNKGANPDLILNEAPLVTNAIQGGNKALAELLIAKGAKLNVVDRNGKTPLMHAAEKGDLATVKALVAKGADLNLRNGDSSAALTLAISEKHETVANLLLAKGAAVKADDLQAAVRTRNLPLISRLIEKGADAKQALLTALPGGGLELVKLLVRKGADPNARDYYSKTPLILEADNWSEADPAVVRCLLDLGADVNAVDDKGMSALHSAAAHGNTAVVKVLVAGGADINLKDGKGNTAWVLAAEKGDRPMLELLEKAGARREFAGMSWQGKDAALKEPFIQVVSDRSEWEALWQRAFTKPAPIVDFGNFAIACVFLGDKADWIYSIGFGKPYLKESVMHVPYRLAMVMLRMAPGHGRTFGGQYAMTVIQKQQGVTYQIDKVGDQGEHDGRLPLMP
jgi:ankyrin repeat protein